MPYGGWRILDHLRQFLHQRNVSLVSQADSYIIRYVSGAFELLRENTTLTFACVHFIFNNFFIHLQMDACCLLVDIYPAKCIIFINVRNEQAQTTMHRHSGLMLVGVGEDSLVQK